MGEFDNLIKAEIPKCGGKGDTGDKLITMKRTPVQGEELVKNILVPAEEAELVKEHGFWFWARFSYTSPQKIRILQEYK